MKMEYVSLIHVFFVHLLLYAIECSSVQIDNIPICATDETSPEQIPEIHLTAHGIGASAYVLLRGNEEDSSSLVGAGIEGRLQWSARGRMMDYQKPQQTQLPCRLKVTAPPGHVVYINVLETRLEIHRALIVHQSERDANCPLNIFLPDTKSKSVYTANMCDVHPVPDVPLLPPELELVWKAPPLPDNTEIEMLTMDRVLLITTVGKETTCRPPTGVAERKKYHTCMKIGWEPILCVSKDLICNGQNNCPKGSTSSDEAEVMCRAPQSLEDIARKIIQEFQLPLGLNEKWVESAKKTVEPSTTESTVANKIVSIWKRIEVSTRKPNLSQLDELSSRKTQSAATTESHTLTISAILNQYGPWGYLMLGMLICGGILLLCGMWECCCRQPKPFLGGIGGHRNSTLGHRSSGGNGGPTVLVINHGDETGETGRPPEYDDLDQPPLYSALFPNNKINDRVVTVIQMQETSTGQEVQHEEQQSHRLSRQNSTVDRSEVIDTANTDHISAPKEDRTTSQSNSTVNSNNSTTSEYNADDTGTTSSGTVHSASNDS